MNDWYPPKSSPRPVEEGLKARTRRGAIGQTWWSTRFVAVLENIGLGNRLERGRTYARKGQVISFDIDAGAVTARVQGSRPRPYRVRLGIIAFGKPQWAKLERVLADSALYGAMLLAGEMPEDIEEVFAGQGLSLFPAAANELSMDCTCPDWEVPCKHIAAVFYLLAEAFDDDPFAILAWRGRDREDLLANLRAARIDGPPAADADTGVTPLAECLDSYFSVQGNFALNSEPGAADGSPLSQLPVLRVAVRGQAVPELLKPAYLIFDQSGSSQDKLQRS